MLKLLFNQMSLRFSTVRMKRFIADERGVTAIEYVLIAGIMAVAVAASFSRIAPALKMVADTVEAALLGK
ncbi:pilus assembly protein Flp/PilA [Fulvimarina manganoxydans]|uniref:Pilus assembly protein Flp/PilA n=1 Tax=Fulvimarina manganoxydans TaxID=937218 RepID=A0A1W1YDP6_9HYPH|nr:Flp family type IVb pilin [Fulvimarina manganoxydans]SMC33888.1 pilus assembly protein Flp/PilA [Fulvimarina manganoxydans]